MSLHCYMSKDALLIRRSRNKYRYWVRGCSIREILCRNLAYNCCAGNGQNTVGLKTTSRPLISIKLLPLLWDIIAVFCQFSTLFARFKYCCTFLWKLATFSDSFHKKIDKKKLHSLLLLYRSLSSYYCTFTMECNY